MERPKTVKAYLKLCKLIAETPMTGMKGMDKLTDIERYELSCLSVQVQNDLGDMPELLQKFNLKYPA